jgi:tRNA nucleotidyltransferase/poly(A) polymerase
MGKESDDIDIALDDMYGEEFAEIIRQTIYDYDLKAGKIDPNKQKQGKNYGVIKSNSEKSKHLETAVIKI